MSEMQFREGLGAASPGPKRSIMVAIPAYSGVITLATADLLFNTMLGCAIRGWGFQRVWRVGDPDLAQLRDIIATVDFLESDCTDLVFLDDDTGSPSPDALLKLCEKPVDFVAAAVPYRMDDPPGGLPFPVRWIPKPNLYADPNTGLLEIDGIGMAMTRLSRRCITTMVQAHPELRFAKASGGFATGLFYPELNTDGQRFSEDYSFCRRWRALGGKIWIDPEIPTMHTGPKTFYGHMGNWLRGRSQKEEARTVTFATLPELDGYP